MIWVRSEKIARELNIGWKCADWKMITAEGNGADSTKVEVAVPINIYCIVIPIPISSEPAGSKQVILGRPWETYTRQCERNLDDGSRLITITTIDEAEQLTFHTTFPSDKRDRFGRSLGNIYA